jgi:hypothetical protein
MLKLWVIALGLSTLLPLASVSQVAGGGLETPSKASVIAPPSQRLEPGQSFKFILRFDHAPHGYVNGKIQYKFQLTSPGGSETHPEGNLQASNQSADLLNDVPDYPLRLRVTHSMLPGTWKLTEVTVIGGAPHPIQILENVTFEVHESALPIKAKIHWDKYQKLEDGESFKFGICLETVPEGYDGGGIHYRFALKNPDPHEIPSGPPAYLSSSVEGGMGLKDGQSCYELPPVPVFQPGGHFENSFLSLGEWKLLEVTLAGRQVLFEDDVTFEVRAPTIVLHVQAPGSVRAGQSFDFKVSVDGYLQNSYCMPTLSVDLRQRSPDRRPNPNNAHVYVNSISLDPSQQQRSFVMSGLFAPDLPDGPWQGEFTVFNELARSMQDRAPQGTCRGPILEGDTRFAFEVEPAAGLQTPTSANVTVNPSQAQLLRAEAARLTAKANLLKQQLGSEGTAANLAMLRKSVSQEISELVKTQASYKEDGIVPSSERAVNVFFDEIRFNYDQALKALSGSSAQSRLAGPRLERVSMSLGDSSPLASSGSDVVLGSFSYNATAYLVAASSATMTFNLEVVSVPKGATVSYKQRTDPDFTPVGQRTDCQIPNLYRAGYSIRFQKPGYEERLYEFNGQTSADTKITVQLIRKGRPK